MNPLLNPLAQVAWKRGSLDTFPTAYRCVMHTPGVCNLNVHQTQSEQNFLNRHGVCVKNEAVGMS